jgi:hypothetical protein
MTKHLLNLLFSVTTCATLCGQTTWGGPVTTFSKAANADWTQPANQDRITSNVWITRAGSEGIFNIKTENSYTNGSPDDTEWALGTTANLASLTFDSWKNTVVNPGSAVNKNMVLHLITDDIYIDIKFTSWSGGNGGGSGGAGGGAFSYERSTNTIGIDEVATEAPISFFPNPASNQIQLDITKTEIVKVFDLTGKELMSTTLEPAETLDISSLETGVYMLAIPGKGNVKLVKE